MKVEFTKEMKEIITVAELPSVKTIIKAMKEDTGLEDYCRTLLRMATGDNCEPIQMSAEICRNNHMEWDYHGEGTGHVDVWIKTLGKYWDTDERTFGYCEAEGYLYDVWNRCGDGDDPNILARMYVKKYVPKY